MKIRKVKKTEWPQLQSLNNEVFIENEKYDPDIFTDWTYSKEGEKYFRELVNDPQSLCLVAEIDSGDLVGYIIASPKPILYRKSKYFEVDSMGVMFDYRSQGIGQKLMNKCIEWAKKNGYQKAYVNSYLSNARAISFYKKCGYNEIDLILEKEI